LTTPSPGFWCDGSDHKPASPRGRGGSCLRLHQRVRGLLSDWRGCPALQRRLMRARSIFAPASGLIRVSCDVAVANEHTTGRELDEPILLRVAEDVYRIVARFHDRDLFLEQFPPHGDAAVGSA